MSTKSLVSVLPETWYLLSVHSPSAKQPHTFLWSKAKTKGGRHTAARHESVCRHHRPAGDLHNIWKLSTSGWTRWHDQTAQPLWVWSAKHARLSELLSPERLMVRRRSRHSSGFQAVLSRSSLECLGRDWERRWEGTGLWSNPAHHRAGEKMGTGKKVWPTVKNSDES